MRKTKIVCTLGPAVDDEKTLEQLMLAGMNVARFNFSHGTHQEHLARLEKVVKLREKHSLHIATMLDTRGPEIRLGLLKEGIAELVTGQTFTLRVNDEPGDATGASLSYKNLYKDVNIGSTILIDDGLIELSVLEIKQQEIICRVCNSGIIKDRKGINVPNVHLALDFLSAKDRDDILFGIEKGFDFVAASFTRSAKDILEIRRLFAEQGCTTMNIIAKIENAEGVANIDEIIRVSDGIMVARGDMGVEIPLEDVPVIQKKIIRKVYSAGKQVITATQMLDSMMKNPRPTRAEATDVANAIYDGTSAIMLSGETAAGLYPVQAVRTMVRLAERTETDIDYVKRFKQREVEESVDVTNAISHATCTTAHDLGAAAIITLTQSGRTARMISKYRVNCPIISSSPLPHVCRQMNLSWGVIPLLSTPEGTGDELFQHACDSAEQAGLVKRGDIVVITTGMPIGVSGTTNLMKVHVVGHVLLTGKGVNDQTVRAPLCVCANSSEVAAAFQDGDILVVAATTNDLLPFLKRASGIITETGDLYSHAAIVGLSLDIPVLVGARNATDILKAGAVVSLDAGNGLVYCD